MNNCCKHKTCASNYTFCDLFATRDGLLLHTIQGYSQDFRWFGLKRVKSDNRAKFLNN